MLHKYELRGNEGWHGEPGIVAVNRNASSFQFATGSTSGHVLIYRSSSNALELGDGRSLDIEKVSRRSTDKVTEVHEELEENVSSSVLPSLTIDGTRSVADPSLLV